MTASKNSWFTHKSAFLSATAGILFLLVAIFAADWNWRSILAFVAGALWLVNAYRQFNKAKPAINHQK